MMTTVVPFTMELHTVDEVRRVAAAVLQAAQGRKVFAFHGELGAGKTTLIKALCAELGVKEGTSSPTFAIVNDYQSEGGVTIHHFDLYRLKRAEELDGIGFNEYIDSGDHCFIEWPEIASHRLLDDTVHVRITPDEHDVRLITMAVGEAP
jgi:tRNA threonylcarbamoyladenosine biosynthesis protein TsaE